MSFGHVEVAKLRRALWAATGAAFVLLVGTFVWAFFYYLDCEEVCSLIPAMLVVSVATLFVVLLLGALIASIPVLREEVDAARWLLRERKRRQSGAP